MKNLNNINSFDFIKFINAKQKFILLTFLVLLILSFILSLGIGSFRIPIINLINFEFSDLEFKVLSEIRTPSFACLFSWSKFRYIWCFPSRFIQESFSRPRTYWSICRSSTRLLLQILQ